MKTELRDSFIAVPVPTALYVSLSDVLSKQANGRDPAGVVVEAIGDWLSHNPPKRVKTRRRSGTHRAADADGSAQWRDEWIMFGAPTR